MQCADGHVRLNPQLSVWLDTERFDAGVDAAQALVRLGDGANTGADAMAAASAAGELARALELVRGDLVAHDRSEAWVEPFRRRFSDRHLLALHALAAYRLQQGDALACTELGHRMLLIDTCNEDAHRLLMSCYDRLSQPARVERQYPRLRAGPARCARRGAASAHDHALPQPVPADRPALRLRRVRRPFSVRAVFSPSRT